MAKDKQITCLETIASELLKYNNFVLCGHINPDGDCIGSILALKHALVDLGKNVTCVFATDASVDAGLAFLPGIQDIICAGDYKDTTEVFIALDVPTLERMGDAATLHSAAKLTITIDHHEAVKLISDFNYIDPNSASCTMLVWKLISHFSLAPNANAATCAYTGLVTDTGRFQFQNTSGEAFELASEMICAGADPALVAREVYQNRSLASIELEKRAIENMRFLCNGEVVLSWVSAQDFSECGAVKADAEPLIDILRSLANIRIACLLKEQKDAIHGSLRAKDESDVAIIAQSFGGGGHKAAAGFKLKKNLSEAISAVEEKLNESFGLEEASACLLSEPTQTRKKV